MKYLLNTLFTKGVTKKSRGHGLLELIVAVTIITIVLSGLISSFVSMNKFFHKDIKEMREKIDLEEALYFIENQIHNQSRDVKVMGNMVILYMKNDPIIKSIKLIDNNLYMLNGHDSNFPKDNGYKNYIVKDVKKFHIRVVDSLLYLELEGVNGVRARGCYLIRN